MAKRSKPILMEIDNNATKPMGINDNNTKPLSNDNNATKPIEIIDSNRMPLSKDVIAIGKYDKYIVKASDQKGKGGESFVYLAKRQSDGKQVAIKIYDVFADNKESRYNRRKTITFLENNNDYKKTHIMPLWDYGAITLGEDEDTFDRPFDIIPFCKDGAITDLLKCDYNLIKNKILPEVLAAMDILHSNNLVHRDIKPSNIYMYDDVILLADFGTTSDIIDKEAHGNTSTRRQTAGYSAPEISENFYVIASDYYSLGCTVATLYNKGNHVHHNLLGKETELRITMRRKGLPLECPTNESDLQILVNALTMGDEKIRAGYDAVKLWIKDSKKFVSGWKNKTIQGFEKPSLNFDFEGIMCNNYDELTNAILNNWEKGKQYLFRGIIANNLSTSAQTLSNNIHNITSDIEMTQNQDLALAMCLHYINTTEETNCPIFWCGEKYESLSEIATAISKDNADESKIIELLKSRFLSWKHENTIGISQETVSSLKEIENITKKNQKIGYFVFMYKNEPTLKKTMPSGDTYFKEITKDPKIWYSKAAEILYDDKSFAYLMCIKDAESVLDIKDTMSGKLISNNNSSDLTKLYNLFDKICMDKTYIREHYLKFAPQAYLYWFKENINLYSFNSALAKDLEKRIKDIKITSDMTINTITTLLFSIWKIFIDCDFYNLFQNNYLLTYMGFHTNHDKSGITTNNNHAFFIYDFHGINVPVGYIKTLGI